MSARQRIQSLFEQLYGSGEAALAAWSKLQTVIELRLDERSPTLRARDAERTGWFLSAEHVGYSCYADRFGGTLLGVASRIPHLHQLGVTYVHLLPVFRTDSEDNDGGFAVSSYREVEPGLGTMRDLRALTDALHQHGMSLCLDFVANHTSRHHQWAQKALQGIEPYLGYYHFLGSQAEVSAAESSLEEVFPESAPGNFTYVPERSAWVWSTFQRYQWDLNYANPLVLVEMVDALLYLANQGVDALRVDSAPFLWKAIGTPCRGLPETHLVLQLFRCVVDLVASSVVLLAEAIVPPKALVLYLGAHEPAVPECHIAYQGVLMPMLWMALVRGDARPLARVLGRRVDAPPKTTWLQYVRSHDNIEWDVLSDDLLVEAGLVPRDVEAAVRFLHGESSASFSDGRPFEGGVSGRLSTNGTTASLCGLTADVDSHETAVARILLLYGILYSLPGFPVVFSGDEMAMRNDEGYVERPNERSDSRWLHRPFLDWEALEHDGAAQAVFDGLRRLGTARRAAQKMTSFSVPERPTGTPSGLLVLERRGAGGARLSIVANVGHIDLGWERELARAVGLEGSGQDLITGQSVANGVFAANAYSVAWVLWQPAQSQG